jgi:hypothetical protein
MVFSFILLTNIEQIVQNNLLKLLTYYNTNNIFIYILFIYEKAKQLSRK